MSKAQALLTIELAVENHALSRAELLALVAHGHIRPTWQPRAGLLLSRDEVRPYQKKTESGRFDALECCADVTMTVRQLARLTGWRLCEAVHVGRYFGAIGTNEPDHTVLRRLLREIAPLLDYRDMQLRHGFTLARHDLDAKSRCRVRTVRCTCEAAERKVAA